MSIKAAPAAPHRRATGYQLRRALDLQADAICYYLGLT
jgi:hypothetical protein